jgi:hypothetical protein
LRLTKPATRQTRVLSRRRGQRRARGARQAGGPWRDLFHVKDRSGCHLAVDLWLDAPPVTVGARLVPVSRAPVVPRHRAGQVDALPQPRRGGRAGRQDPPGLPGAGVRRCLRGAAHRGAGCAPGHTGPADRLRVPGARGQVLRVSNFRRNIWRPAILAANLDGLRIHDLRHTAVALWIAAGASPKEVAQRAGHTSVSFVLDPGRFRWAAGLLRARTSACGLHDWSLSARVLRARSGHDR